MKLLDKIDDFLFGSKSKLITKGITIAAGIYVLAIIIMGLITNLF
jgi:hypothetical protein